MKPHDEKLKQELKARGLLTDAQIERVASEMSKSRSPFKQAALRLGLLKEEEIAAIEAGLLQIPFLDINEYLIADDIVAKVPEKVARERLVMPIFKVGKNLTIATADPLDILAIDEVRSVVGGDVEIVLSTKEMIRRAIEQSYGAGRSVEEAVKAFSDAPGATEEAPVIKLVHLLLLRALQEKASDVHIEPEENSVRVRNRVDGLLRESAQLPKKLHASVVSRIKIMSRLDIAESRKPQDGKIRLRIDDRELDIRVSTFPTMHGENVVLRLLEPSRLILGLGQLGMEPSVQKAFGVLIRKAYGMVLVTGPTGSGKTTTLYGALSLINTIDKNIITIEDPVEYQLELVRQTQVNTKAGLTFASGLRSILRQDPDVILVGEIRDSETADVAVQAALTGHLVLSSVHTNDAAGAVARLQDMQIEPFLISSALVGVLAQRLVRTLCQKCKEPYTVGPDVLKKLGIDETSSEFFRPKGCPQCGGTGYDKRIGIFELLVVDEAVRRLIAAKAPSSEIRAEAVKNGMIPMRADGVEKARRGITTLEEVLKVTQEGD